MGTPISLSFAATGGVSPITYALSPTSGPLPPGLMLDPATGLVSGTTTTPGTYPFTVTATDATGASASATATVVVNAALAINPITPPQGAVGSSYSAQLSATGGTAPVTFALSGGTTLPPGLALSPAGLISGTPTTAGTFAFTVMATDSSGAVASLPLSIVVTSASQVAAPTVQNLQRFGFHAQPTTFVLTFSTALDPATAQNVANYRLNVVIGHKLGPRHPDQGGNLRPDHPRRHAPARSPGQPARPLSPGGQRLDADRRGGCHGAPAGWPGERRAGDRLRGHLREGDPRRSERSAPDLATIAPPSESPDNDPRFIASADRLDRHEQEPRPVRASRRRRSGRGREDEEAQEVTWRAN